LASSSRCARTAGTAAFCPRHHELLWLVCLLPARPGYSCIRSLGPGWSPAPDITAPSALPHAIIAGAIARTVGLCLGITCCVATQLYLLATLAGLPRRGPVRAVARRARAGHVRRCWWRSSCRPGSAPELVIVQGLTAVCPPSVTGIFRGVPADVHPRDLVSGRWRRVASGWFRRDRRAPAGPMPARPRSTSRGGRRRRRQPAPTDCAETS